MAPLPRPARARSVARRLRHRMAALSPVHHQERWSPEKWRLHYASGRFDYMADLLELPRYSILAGYVGFLHERPSVLDVGCGQGLLRRRLADTAFSRYLGIDPTEAAIELARPLADERTEFRVTTTADPSLEPHDVVVLNEVLYMVPDPHAVLRESARLTAAGGHVLISCWRHRRDEQLWRSFSRHLDLLDVTEVANPASEIAPRGWRVAVYRPRAAR
jgi:2-polyprenyl-3-methyl-5-hydroxy-6-metoxy-1,4-benzoquinol methylase